MRCVIPASVALLGLAFGGPRLLALDRSQVTFHAPLDGSLVAWTPGGAVANRPGLQPTFVPGIRGEAVRLGQSVWGETAELPVLKMPVDVGLWRAYGNRESLGPLCYPASGLVRDTEGTLSFWLQPLGWDLANARDHFAVNLGMRDSLALAYFTYFGCFSFQNSSGENTYKRCIAYLPPDLQPPKPTRDRWTHITLAWRQDLMKTWMDGKPLALERDGIIPLRNATGELRFGSGDHQEAAVDDVIVLAQAVGDADALALYRRNLPAEGSVFLTVPPVAPPALDGKATTAQEWDGGACLTGWADTLLGVANRDLTEVCVGHDRTTLFVRFVWPVPEAFRAERTRYVGSPLRATQKERDADLSGDDLAGVYVAPPGGSTFLFAANGGGARRDERDGDPAWNGDWQVSQTWDDNAWTVEFAIPLAPLVAGAQPPTDQGGWAINFVHAARQVELQDSIWAFQPAAVRPLARLALSPVKLSYRASLTGSLNEGTIAVAGMVSNQAAESATGTVAVTVSDDGRAVFGPEQRTWSLAAGEKTEWSVAGALPRPLYGSASVELKDGKGDPVLLYRLPFVFARELKIEAHYVPTPALLQAVIDLGSTATLAKAAGGTLRVISPADGKTWLSQAIPAFPNVRGTFSLDCREVPVGTYELVADLTVGGAQVSLKDTFTKDPPPEWLGSQAGISDAVPAPWTPLETSGPTVSCWGRSYRFGAAGLPAQISVLGQEILAGPVRLVLTAKGEARPFPEGRTRLGKASPARVPLTASSKLGGVEANASAWVEFDGFCWNTLTVTPAKPLEVEGLALEFPLKPEFATLWWPAEYVPSGPGGETPRTPCASDPINGLRIGDEEHGLQFSFETTAAWRVDPGKGQELLPGAADYVVRFNLIGKPTRLEAPSEFAFGLQALPSRPRSPVFRLIDMDGCWSGLEKADRAYLDRTGKLFSIRAVYTEGWSRHWNYLNFWNPEVFEPEFIGRVKEGTRQGWETVRNTLCLYLNVVATDANTPEYRTYRHEWRPVPGEAPHVPADPAGRDKAVMGSVCINAPSYTDFYMASLDRTMKTLTDDDRVPVHVYLDNSGQLPCANTLHGCPAAGHVNVLGHREYMKRLYTIVKAPNQRNQVLIHCSGDNRMSSWSFADVLIEGEQMTAYYASKLANDPSLPKDYTRLITLAKARSQFQPLAFGPDKFYLYQFWGWNKTEPDEAGPARAHLLGLMMVHDSPCWAAGNAANIVNAIEDLGWDDLTEFVPYWRRDNGLALKTAVQPVVASGWTHGRGNLLVMVFSDSDSGAPCELTVDLARFGFSGATAKVSDYGHGGLAHPDSLRPQEVGTLAFEPGRPLTIDMAARSYRLLRLHE
jgi:hypothetical protein